MKRCDPLCSLNNTMMNNISAAEPEIDETTDEVELIASVMVKLKENANLTGYERQHIIDLLQKCPNISTVKRKIQEVENDENAGPKIMKNRKVQAKPSNFKESFAQTDDIVNILNEGDQSEQFIIKIKRLATADQKNADEIAELMSKSFDDRRNSIMLTAPAVRLVKDQYPLLFSIDEVKNELDRIFYKGKCADFLDSIKVYSMVVLEESKNDPLYKIVMKHLSKCSTEREKKYVREVGSLLLLPAIFREDIRFINLSDNECAHPEYPYIEASMYKLKQLFDGGCQFKIKVEGYVLCEASNVSEAVLCLVACYFIFNINYNPDNERTFVALEKLYLCVDEAQDLDEFTDKMIKLLKSQRNKS